MFPHLFRPPSLPPESKRQSTVGVGAAAGAAGAAVVVDDEDRFKL